MFTGPLLAVLFLLGPSSAQTRVDSCLCSVHGPVGLKVDCHAQNLTELPLLPSDVFELHLQDNQLTTIRPGQLDSLHSLRVANLSRNPWHCDCDILYLSAWLGDHGDLAGNPTCATPAELAHKPIVELTKADLPECTRNICHINWLDVATFLLLSSLITLLLWFLWMAKNSTITFNVDQRHAGMEAHRLQSRKPKHRRKRHEAHPKEAETTLEWNDDLEGPLLNMEILPQILDVLQNEHNIKFKET